MGGAAGEERLCRLADREALQGGQHQRLHDVWPPGHGDQQLHREGRGTQPDVHISGTIQLIQSYNEVSFHAFLYPINFLTSIQHIPMKTILKVSLSIDGNDNNSWQNSIFSCIN